MLCFCSRSTGSEPRQGHAVAARADLGVLALPVKREPGMLPPGGSWNPGHSWPGGCQPAQHHNRRTGCASLLTIVGQHPASSPAYGVPHSERVLLRHTFERRQRMDLVDPVAGPRRAVGRGVKPPKVTTSYACLVGWGTRSGHLGWMGKTVQCPRPFARCPGCR